MTSKKRKYGDLSARQPQTSDPSLVDDVFAAFTGQKPLIEEAVGALDNTPPSPTIPNHPQPPPFSTRPLAPERDFNKRANSIDKVALPQGLFPGSSKKLWDAIYLRTRGAVVPLREIQATKRDLMAWSGIKNIKTIETHVRYFVAAGMMTKQGENGDPAGYRYGIILLEEIPIPTPTIPNQHEEIPTPTIPNQKTVMGQAQKTVMVGEGNLADNKGTSEISKTFIKTNTENDDDDAALAGLNAALKQAAKELTGKDVSPSESARWRELAEVLITEAKIAGARTTVSSFPAFLAEHLRRRLWKKDKSQLESEGRTEAQQTAEAPSLTEEQIKSCPDCGGSTWYYPEGPEKGIKRCRHEKLQDSEAEKR